MSDMPDNYQSSPFFLLGIKPAFEIDLTALNEAYFTRQVLAHPDRYIFRPDSERVAASRESSSLNEAYDILKDPVLRAKALFRLYGFEVPGEDVHGKEQSIQDPEILSEMMDLQEMLRDAVSPRDYKTLEEKLHTRLEEVMDALTEAFDASYCLEMTVPEFHKQELAMHYLRLSYLYKIKKNIKHIQRQSSIKTMR